MNKINWSNKARKQLLRLPRKTQDKIYDAVDQLRHFPEVGQIKRLKNHCYGYRLRIGQYRVLFNFEQLIHIVWIEEVKKRDDRTY